MIAHAGAPLWPPIPPKRQGLLLWPRRKLRLTLISHLCKRLCLGRVVTEQLLRVSTWHTVNVLVRYPVPTGNRCRSLANDLAVFVDAVARL